MLTVLGVVSLIAIGAQLPVAALATQCTRFDVQIGGCPSTSAHVGRGQVDVSAEVSAGGSHAGDDASAPGSAGTDILFVHRNASDCSSTDPIARTAVCRNDVTFTMGGTSIPWRPITMADLESFRPTAPTFSAEPDGWAVVGLPANFVAHTGQETVPGTLLGQPAEVRFTPHAFTWQYGDGAPRTTAEPGATWAALGLGELATTATSHVYEKRGRADASLTVTYGAEYRFLGPAWIPVVGTLEVTTRPFPVLVVTASTMLVTGNCTMTTGPGC